MTTNPVTQRSSRRAGIAWLLWLLAATALAPIAQAQDKGGLVLGVFPRFNAMDTTTRYTPIAEYLQERLGRKVSLVTSKDFHAFWQGIEERRYDIVQYNQYHFIRSAKSYQVIAHNKEFGKSTMAGAVYVRKDSGITSLAQLRGRTVLFGGGEDAMMAYIAPVYMMLQAGLKKDDFKSQFAVTPINSVIGVFHRQADAAGTGDNVVGQPVIRNAINMDELTALAVSEQLLHLPWAVKRTMPAQLRETVRSSLVDLENSESGRNVLKAALLTGIGKAEDKDYEPHRKMVRAVMGAAATQ
jgi:phosphonate transport system substrate-binding protein